MPFLPELLTAKEVAATLRITREHLWVMVRAERFPRPIYVGPKAPRWKAHEVTSWIASRPDSKAAA